MKTLPFLAFLSLSICGLLLTSCHTASYAAHGAVDESVHVVDKTGRVLAHGARKVERNL